MKTIFCMVLGLLVTILSPARAQIFIEGSLDCGVWIDSRSQQKSVSLEHFVLGMINGMSLGSNVSIWGYPNASVSRKQTFLWFDKYCRDNPLRQVTEGAVKFADEMTNDRYSKTIQSHSR